MLFAVGPACATDDIEDLGTLTDGKSDTLLPRIVELDLAAGDSQRFRITTPAFVASLEQTGAVAAELTAKHYDFEYASDTLPEPRVAAIGDGTTRNWTLTVFNRGTATLTAKLVVDVPRASGELGIVSDIDKTVMPPETAAGSPPPYPGIALLLATFEGNVTGDMHYVTARTPDRAVDLPDWMALHDVPAGTIDTGISGLPWVAQPEKVADITRLFDATVDQSYVLLGDTAQRDPEVYREIKAKYPDRVTTIFIHKVNATVPPARVEGMHLVDNYAQAAAIAFGEGVITEAQARAVMTAAKAEGLAITPAEIEALLDAAR
ncbi:MAG: phosphatase domain-containing protein [Kofleriaceae bacterium]